MPTKRRTPRTKTKRKTKYKSKLSTIYEPGASPNRTFKKNNQPRLLNQQQHNNTISQIAKKKAQEIQREDKQLGCFGRFCKNIKSKLTRRAGTRAGTRRRAGTRAGTRRRAGTKRRAGTRRRRGTRKKRTRKRTR